MIIFRGANHNADVKMNLWRVCSGNGWSFDSQECSCTILDRFSLSTDQLTRGLIWLGQLDHQERYLNVTRRLRLDNLSSGKVRIRSAPRGSHARSTDKIAGTSGRMMPYVVVRGKQGLGFGYAFSDSGNWLWQCRGHDLNGPEDLMGPCRLQIATPLQGATNILTIDG